jgi:hypothetical protein
MRSGLFQRLIILKVKTRYLLRSFRHLITHPDSFRYVPRWIGTFSRKRNTLTDESPWITFKAIEWLDDQLHKDMKVFEYGSGGSSIFFGKRAGSVISIEHDTPWYHFVSEILEQKKMDNTTLRHIPSQEGRSEPGPDGTDFNSSEPEFENSNFEKYVRSIEDYPDDTFNLVSVDGRSRVACVKQALKKVKKGGYLLLDNSEREKYREASEFMKDYDRIDFTGLCPYTLYPTQTTCWKIH